MGGRENNEQKYKGNGEWDIMIKIKIEVESRTIRSGLGGKGRVNES